MISGTIPETKQDLYELALAEYVKDKNPTQLRAITSLIKDRQFEILNENYWQRIILNAEVEIKKLRIQELEREEMSKRITVNITKTVAYADAIDNAAKQMQKSNKRNKRLKRILGNE